jgi:nanoRNase/pAp phosphatase (c-di-AMP/oligoRNAs hydrolase)
MSKAQSLHELLSGGSEINIVCHNNPDPDCLASALALGRLAAAAGIDERRILYSGDISHQ